MNKINMNYIEKYILGEIDFDSAVSGLIEGLEIAIEKEIMEIWLN